MAGEGIGDCDLALPVEMDEVVPRELLERVPEIEAQPSGDFACLCGPRAAPVVTITGPSAAHAAEKAAFETEHLERWFGA